MTMMEILILFYYILQLKVRVEISFIKSMNSHLYENKGNRIFEDVTQQKIEGYYNMDPEKFGEFYF